MNKFTSKEFEEFISNPHFDEEVILNKDPSWPKISIVTPSYNQAAFLEKTILSVLNQNYPNLEYIIIDGGSNDGSIEIIKKYERYLAYWVSEPDKGQSDAINKGWKLSTGEVLGWLNSDDIYYIGTFENIAIALKKHPDSKILFGDCMVINRFGKEIAVKCPKNYTAKSLILGKSLPQPSTFIHRDVLNCIGYLNPSLHYALDWAYFLKALLHYSNQSYIYIPKILSISREYEGTKSRTGLYRKANERRTVLSEYFREYSIFRQSSIMKRKSWTGTYWVQGTDEFLAGFYWKAFQSALCAVFHDPIGFLNKLSKIVWLFKEHLRRKIEFKVIH